MDREKPTSRVPGPVPDFGQTFLYALNLATREDPYPTLESLAEAQENSLVQTQHSSD